MTRNSCAECRLAESFHEEIGEALAEEALASEEKRVLAREALSAKTPVPGTVRRRKLAFAGLVAATAVVAVFLAIDSRDPGRDPDRVPTPAAGPSVADARVANDRALRTEAVRRELAAAPAGAFAVVAEGRLIGVSPDLAGLLARAERETPDAVHRYVFPVGEEGDQVYEQFHPFGRKVGTKFFEQAGVRLFERDAPDVGIYYDGNVLRMRIPLPSSAEAAAEDVDFRVASAFTGPLLLPPGRTYPRFEIPGRATVAWNQRVEHRYRRYLLRLTLVPRKESATPWGPRWYEALGDGLRMLSFAGTVWPHTTGETTARAARQGGALLEIRGDTRNLPFAAFDADAVRTELWRFVRSHFHFEHPIDVEVDDFELHLQPAPELALLVLGRPGDGEPPFYVLPDGRAFHVAARLPLHPGLTSEELAAFLRGLPDRR